MKTKVFTSLFLGILLLSFQLSRAQDVIVDGRFDTTTIIQPYTPDGPPINCWTIMKNTGIEAIATVESGVCKYEFTNSGIDAWEVQLEQYGLTFQLCHTYRLTFDVRADADRTFGLYLGEYYGNWSNLLRWEDYTQNATTDWKTLSFDFKATCIFAMTKLSFEMGGNNTSMYFDNISIVDLGPYTPDVGILGTSLPGGWDIDVDMLTTDGVNYTLSNYLLMSGAVKFRQDNAWCINWGDYTFPTGIGYQDGPNIPVLSYGNYDITFNRLTGEYSFVCVSNCPVAIGIIGTAVPPGSEFNMSTNDGVNYFLKGIWFNNGEAKFRQDNSDDISWGNTDFPMGTALLGGPGIPVTEGAYDVTFNIVTGEYNFSFVLIGIIGDALLGWDTDVDMQTTDGINYTLTEYTFTNGTAKFRLDNSWDSNWGDNTFPTGWLYWYGPDIPVLAGTYNVSLSLTTSRYNFVATNCPVAGIICPDNIYTGNSPGECGAYVYYPEVIPAYNCGGEGITIVQTAGLASGELFPIGTTTNTFVLTNAEGNTATCSFDVVVNDSEPPVITDVDAHIKPIWPPNHKMICVKIDYNSSDNCAVTNCGLAVSSNEPVDGHGKCPQQPDWIVLDDHHVLLKAERDGHGRGREYTITITCSDGSYNAASQQVIVKIPHDRRGPCDKKDFGGDLCMFEFRNPLTGTSFTKSEMMDNSFESIEFNVEAWPNPTTNNFNLQVESSSNETIDVFVTDVIGRQISRFQSTNKSNLIFGDDLQPGIYLVKVIQGDNSEIIKVVKQ